MTKESTAVATFKLWVFPSLVSIIGMLIWNDVSEIKADIKELMAQSNIDKTRIDNLERQVYSQLTSVPETPKDGTLVRFSTYALLPNNEKKVIGRDTAKKS